MKRREEGREWRMRRESWVGHNFCVAPNTHGGIERWSHGSLTGHESSILMKMMDPFIKSIGD